MSMVFYKKLAVIKYGAVVDNESYLDLGIKHFKLSKKIQQRLLKFFVLEIKKLSFICHFNKRIGFSIVFAGNIGTPALYKGLKHMPVGM